MEQPGLHGRHRNKSGEISRKHGNTQIGTLRRVYGPRFAPGHADTETLGQVLEEMDDHSLSQLVHDHEEGHLDHKIAAAKAH